MDAPGDGGGEVSQGMKETFESYGPKKVINKIILNKRYIGPITAQWSIPTPEGTVTADVGDYIVEGVNGAFYAVKPDVFAKYYEPA